MRTLYFAFAFLFCLTASAQRIRDFNVYDGGNGSVAVRFSLSPGISCTGYEIMHSIDSMVYKSVYFYDQVCGGSGTLESFEWTHSAPALNQTNYYKIQLMSPYEVSDIRKVYVTQPGRSRMQIWPNPVLVNTDVITVKAFNAGSVKLVGYLYNRFGTPLSEVEMYTHSDIATYNVGSLADGLYILVLTDGTNQYSSKFIVIR